jgi:hypothetical protein
MIIASHASEEEKVRVGHRLRRNGKFLADLEILKILS